MTAQGLCAVLAGALADVVGADVAISVLAAASLAVTAALVPALARAEAAAHGPRTVSQPQTRAGRTQKSLPDGSA